jgi:hypothetical protein
MKTNRLLPFVGAIVISSMIAVPVLKAEDKPAEAPATAKPDFGDFSSQTLAKKSWAALEAKKYDDLKAYVGKCRELYEAKAVEMQKSLKEPAASGKEHDYWALNDVGTCSFILAKALDNQGKKTEAITAYKEVAEKFTFAQCWDPQGWFWKPAEASKDRIKELEFDSAK